MENEKIKITFEEAQRQVLRNSKDYKTFADLAFKKATHDKEASIDFENGYGVSIWKMQQHRMEGVPYAGCLNKNGKLHIDGYHELQWANWMNESDVTEYMRKVQQLI